MSILSDDRRTFYSLKITLYYIPRRLLCKGKTVKIPNIPKSLRLVCRSVRVKCNQVSAHFSPKNLIFSFKSTNATTMCLTDNNSTRSAALSEIIDKTPQRLNTRRSKRKQSCAARDLIFGIQSQSEQQNQHQKRAKVEKSAFDATEWVFTSLQSDDDATLKKRSGVSEIHGSLTNVLWRRTFNTPEPKVGANLLLSNTVFNHQGWNGSLGQELLDFLLDGPKCERHKYPDPIKVNLVMQLIAETERNPALMQKCIEKCCPKDWAGFEDCMVRLSTQSYRSSGGVGECLANSLHLCASAANFLTSMLGRDIVVLDITKENGSLHHRETPFARILLSNNKGIQDSVEAVVNLYANEWRKYAPLLFVPPDSPAEVCPKILDRCKRMAQMYLEHLGQLTRWAIWLLSTTIRSRRSKETSCVKFLSNILESDFNDVLLNGLPLESIQLLKVNMVLNLSHECESFITDFVEEIQRRVALRLRVSKELYLFV